MSILRPGDRILFQGDSITDAGRREPAHAPLGSGYVAHIAGLLAVRNPDLTVELINRGISGNRTPELLARWQEDCLDLRPQVVSIKIGVNDVWRKRGPWNGQSYVPLPNYQEHLRNLCQQTLATGVRTLVLMSPTTIDANAESDLNQELGTYAAWVAIYAAEIGAIFVDVRSPLLRARAQHPTIPWTPDGCHPSAAGHALLASVWYDTVVART